MRDARDTRPEDIPADEIGEVVVWPSGAVFVYDRHGRQIPPLQTDAGLALLPSLVPPDRWRHITQAEWDAWRDELTRERAAREGAGRGE